MKFCCNHFEGYYHVGNGYAPNIKIVKFTSPYLISNGIRANDELENARKKSKRRDLRYFITFGYEKFSFDIPLMVINYCPFCGTNLYKFYNNDEYINEKEGSTFTL